MILAALAAVPVAIWLYLLLGRGAFWHASERDHWQASALQTWPRVAAVIPARDEAANVGASIGSLFAQNYAGEFTVLLVDDDSSDDTAAVARATAAVTDAGERFRLLSGAPLPKGWTGKLWAMKQGIDAVQAATVPPHYLLLTDADIVYEPGVLKDLVAQAEARGLVLASLMVKLRCESLAERMLIPAFIFFFQMLFPFPRVNCTADRTAAAAGGCMLVRADALRQAGGIDVIRSALIDDCALARLLKSRGPIWLGLTERVHSIRAYPDIGDIGQMVARTAYAQLGYSPLILAGTVASMAVTYLAPPLFALGAGGAAQWLGLVAWLMMAISFQPTLRLYKMTPLWGVALPAIALCYLLFTLDSALQYARRKGGLWKGRIQATNP